MKLSKRDVEQGYQIALQTALERLLTKAEGKGKAEAEVPIPLTEAVVLRGECDGESDAVVYLWDKKTGEKVSLVPGEPMPRGYGWETLVTPLAQIDWHLNGVQQTVNARRRLSQGRPDPL